METMEEIISKIEELENAMLEMELANRTRQDECMECMNKAIKADDEEKYNEALVGSNKACVLANQLQASRCTLEHMIDALNFANNR